MYTYIHKTTPGPLANLLAVGRRKYVYYHREEEACGGEEEACGGEEEACLLS